jgi:hypothetical protein
MAVVQELYNGLDAINQESGRSEIVQRLLSRVGWSGYRQRTKLAGETRSLPVAETSWPDESLDRLCDPARTVVAPQVLGELAQLAREFDNLTGDELFRLAKDAVVAAQLASAQPLLN